jgi:hypothetical protein
VVGEAVDYCGGHSRIRVDGREWRWMRNGQIC